MTENHLRHIAESLHVSLASVRNTVELLDQDATIPFISRYRKERTGGLDEVQIGAISDLRDFLTELDKRKQTIRKTIEELGLLTPELNQRIEGCLQANELEDLYLPFKSKRRTRAQTAREKGLEPLAKILMAQQVNDLEKTALPFVKEAIEDIEEALSGARDIIAEWVSEHERARQTVRYRFAKEAVITCKVIKGKEAEAQKYRDYFDGSEPLKRCSSHRYAAMLRGENEGFLRVSVSVEEATTLADLERIFVRGRLRSSDQVMEALKDAYKRLIKPSIETEFRGAAKERSDDEAIRIFAGNLSQLLMAPPLGQQRVLGIDPGFRTGCKVVCLDAQGKLLHNETIYPHAPQHQTVLAGKKIVHLVESYDIQAIAIGNGTASRETEAFIQQLRFDRAVSVFVVSENGASIYSASKIARDEFPQYDVTVRGAVSIGRRLMDPLAELVKIEPKSIGVGQYQHDVNPVKLQKTLDQTVIHCVNKVGVNLNTASKYLLTYVSGLNASLAQHIVDYRDAQGPFTNRNELLRVPRLGPKAFEQAAGFLRIPNGTNPLDNTAVHPERYPLVTQIANDVHCSVETLIHDKEQRKAIVPERYLSDTVGLPTLTDILQELDKPGRDPRNQIEVFEFDRSIRTLNDLLPGMILPGIVTNITAFGCFVDIGIKENGLVHLSQMADRYVTDPTQVVSLHQHVRVKVLSIDAERHRIQLSFKNTAS